MAKTNKALLKAGLSMEEILELIESYLTGELSFKGEYYNQLVHNVSVEGYDEFTHVFCSDYLGRNYDIAMSEENPETIYFDTTKQGDEDFEVKNVKEFKSITALLNHIKRMNKNA